MLVTLALAVIGFAFWLGGLQASVEKLASGDTAAKLKAELTAHAEVLRSQLGGIAVGTIVPYAGRTYDESEIPKGWLLCDGSPVPDGEQYAALRNLLKNTAWGVKDGKQCLPDLRGRFLRGVDDPDGPGTIAAAGKDVDGRDRQVGSAQGAATAVPTNAASGIGSTGTIVLSNSGGGGPAVLQGGAHVSSMNPKVFATPEGWDKETRPANAAVNWIIKY